MAKIGSSGAVIANHRRGDALHDRRARPGVPHEDGRLCHALSGVVRRLEILLGECCRLPRTLDRNLRALEMTDAELKLIARAAIIGDSSQPVIG